MGIVEDIKGYYESKNISPTDFDCPHGKDCKGQCEGFVPAREPYIGVEYELHTDPALPRLLFLSLDPGSIGDPDEWLRTVEGVRDCEEKRFKKPRGEWFRGPRGSLQHWHFMHEMAGDLLRPLKPDLSSAGDVSPYIAHTNSAKCCLNNEGRRQADRRLYDYCREFVGGELKVLQPDVLVTQGNWAKEAVVKSFSPVREGGTVSCKHMILDFDRREVLWIHTHHPRYGGFHTQRKQCGDAWAGAVRDFTEKR